MSKQPRRVRDALVKLKSEGILLPEDRNPRQLWLLVVMHPGDNHSGEVFVTHGANYDKFHNRKGFEVIGHGFDRGALTLAARKLTSTLGPNYRSKFSAFKTPNPVLAPEPESEPSAPTQTPDDFLDAVGAPQKPN